MTRTVRCIDGTPRPTRDPTSSDLNRRDSDPDDSEETRLKSPACGPSRESSCLLHREACRRATSARWRRCQERRGADCLGGKRPKALLRSSVKSVPSRNHFDDNYETPASAPSTNEVRRAKTTLLTLTALSLSCTLLLLPNSFEIVPFCPCLDTMCAMQSCLSKNISTS